MLIYMITNRITGKEYIGQTARSLNKRRNEHLSDTFNNKDNCHIHNTIRKYGPENFDWEILHTCNNTDDLNKLEIYYIRLYDTFKNGYNLTEGGDGGILGFKHSEKSKLKMKEAERKKGKDHPMWGRENKWGNHTEETKQNMAIVAKNRKPFSDATRQKMSNSHNGTHTGKDSPVARAVIIKDRYFDTLKEASIFVGRHITTVRGRILHKTKWLDYSYAK